MAPEKHPSTYYEQELDIPSRQEAAAVIVPVLVELVGPASVVDVGCGTGAWLSTFKEHGIEDVVGVDSPAMGSSLLSIPREQFLGLDLAYPFTFDRKFDLAICLEVGEHLPESCARDLVTSVSRTAAVVAFSAAIPWQGGDHHVNEQWQSYWASLFQECGLVPLDCIRPKIWGIEMDAWWYAQNLLLYVDPTTPEGRTLAAQYGSGELLLDVVHPRCYLRWVQAGRHPSGRRGLEAIIAAIGRRISRFRWHPNADEGGSTTA